MSTITAYEKVQIARDTKRPKINDYIDILFDNFMTLTGDHVNKEDSAILGGIATFHGLPVTIIGHRKGRTLEENVKCHFGMSGPEGYRKAIRLMKQAEKFNRPIITFIDTPGAYPGIEAEENGQSIAIAECMAVMSNLKSPIIVVITGEGNSGGALAIGVGNTIIMLENAVYSILSPEGFSSILWKDGSRTAEACELMKMTADDLKQFNIIDEIINEPEGGLRISSTEVFEQLDLMIQKEIQKYSKMSGETIAKKRYQKFRKIDQNAMLIKETR